MTTTCKRRGKTSNSLHQFCIETLMQRKGCLTPSESLRRSLGLIDPPCLVFGASHANSYSAGRRSVWC